MRKTYTRAGRLVDRLEKKYQQKLQTQRYKNNNSRDSRQSVVTTDGALGEENEELSPVAQQLGGYEYVSRKQ